MCCLFYVVSLDVRKRRLLGKHKTTPVFFVKPKVGVGFAGYVYGLLFYNSRYASIGC